MVAYHVLSNKAGHTQLLTSNVFLTFWPISTNTVHWLWLYVYPTAVLFLSVNACNMLWPILLGKLAYEESCHVLMFFK